MNNTTKGLLVALSFILPLSIGVYYGVMQYVMGVLLVIIGVLKLVSLERFSNNFRKYDILAKRSKFYSLFYPFLELGAGAVLLFAGGYVLLLQLTLVALLIAMLTTLVSVSFFVKGEQVCGCLGILSDRLNIPLTLFTKIENIVMSIMIVILGLATL